MMIPNLHRPPLVFNCQTRPSLSALWLRSPHGSATTARTRRTWSIPSSALLPEAVIEGCQADHQKFMQNRTASISALHIYTCALACICAMLHATGMLILARGGPAAQDLLSTRPEWFLNYYCMHLGDRSLWDPE